MNPSAPTVGLTTSERRSGTKDWVRALQLTSDIENDPHRTLPVAFDELAQRYTNAPCLISDHESYSFGELAERLNRYARWGLAQGLRPGDSVCLMMENRAEYIAIWLGLSRIGVIVALLNVSLAKDSLAHCIRMAKADRLIASAIHADVCRTALMQASLPLEMRTYGESGDERHRIEIEIDRLSGAPLAGGEKRNVSLSDRALYIYTSGTTGLPKAAVVTHRRIMNWSYWFAGLMDTRPDDRMYNCLPMYHSIGGVVAVWAVLLGGGSVAIREHFSAGRFFDEVIALDCTLFQYIGELCRYLVNTGPNAKETSHRLRLCCGNGLGADVWAKFRERFAIPRILEFYAATESNFSLYNVEGEVGAIGRIPPFLAHRSSVAIVKFDFDREEPLRDANGRCVLCAPGEIGEAIGKIENQGKDSNSNFDGYSNKADTERKVLRNVFADSDSWMRSGDLMRKDERGFYYFVDRIGDTFRWKGENVSTAEVAIVIASCLGVIEANVYGVCVAGHVGRAGMAALVVDSNFDLRVLRRHVNDHLPNYARPLFLRVRDKLHVTETFKHKKGLVLTEGFDPCKTGEALFFAQPGDDTYLRIDEELHRRIQRGEFRL
jgi:fatty-acyl-CoA synthase